MARRSRQKTSTLDPASRRDGVLMTTGVTLIFLQVGAYYVFGIAPDRDFVLAALSLCFGFPFAMRALEVIWGARAVRDDRSDSGGGPDD